MNLNYSFVFAKTSAFIPRFTWQQASADIIFRRKDETARGRFASAQAYHIGSSLSSDFRGINAQQVLVCKRRQPIKRRLRPYGIVICLDIWKYISLRFSPCSIVLMMYKFTFETTEKVFCYGINRFVRCRKPCGLLMRELFEGTHKKTRFLLATKTL